MSFFNEKWRNSGIFTKVSAFSMALCALLLLVCSILFFSFGGTVRSSDVFQDMEASSVLGEYVGMYGFIWLIAFLYTALLAFGLFKVNRAARIMVIYGGLVILLPYVLLAILFIISLTQVPWLKDILSAYFNFLQMVLPFIMSFVPGDAKALAVFLMIAFVGPFVLNVFSMLILFIFGKDFRSGGVKSKLVAYLLWFFLGSVSAHKFYLEKDRVGLLYFFTFQVFGFAWFINLFTLGKQVDAYNAKLAQSGGKPG